MKTKLKSIVIVAQYPSEQDPQVFEVDKLGNDRLADVREVVVV